LKLTTQRLPHNAFSNNHFREFDKLRTTNDDFLRDKLLFFSRRRIAPIEKQNMARHSPNLQHGRKLETAATSELVRASACLLGAGF